MTQSQPCVYEMAGGDIDVWVDPGGAICLKIRSEFNDPVELAEHEAIALGELLVRLGNESSRAFRRTYRETDEQEPAVGDHGTA